jgi:hypothetical protein
LLSFLSHFTPIDNFTFFSETSLLVIIVFTNLKNH